MDNRTGAEPKHHLDQGRAAPMGDEELLLISEAIAWRVEAAKKSPATRWDDRAAVVGRMTYSAERLLCEVLRQRERIEELEAALVVGSAALKEVLRVGFPPRQNYHLGEE